MKKKCKISKFFAVVFISFLLFNNVNSLAQAAQSVDATQETSTNTKAAPYMITDINDPEFVKLFPGEVFRQVVFDAVKNGGVGGKSTDDDGNLINLPGTAVDNDPTSHQPGCTSDLEDALYNFRGIIKHDAFGKPDSEKIKNIGGIDKLRNVELIEIKYNAITDFNFSMLHSKDWYGQLIAADTKVAIDAKNVVWDFSGNSIERLPADFGGRLIIKQPGSSSYTYDEDLSQSFVYIRQTGTNTVTGTLDIQKSSIYNPSTATFEPVGIENCAPFNGRDGATNTGIKITKIDDTTANFIAPIKGGTTFLSVGTKEVVKYATQDEYANITSGAQSFKYYLTYTMKVYDSITAETFSNGVVELIKTDEDSKAPIAGAEYGIFKSDGTQVTSAITNADGKLHVEGLWGGDYYFQEVNAPDGYLLNPDKIVFTVTGTNSGSAPIIKIDGGESSITTTDGQTIDAPVNRYQNPGRLFSGGRDLNGNRLSPDITLDLQAQPGLTPNNIEVTYSKLEVNGVVETNVVRSFATIQDAQDDINNEKSYSFEVKNGSQTQTHYSTNILGPVSVVAFFDDGHQPGTAFTTTNKAAPKIDISGSKTWVDYNDGLHLRPDTVTITLLRDGKEYKTMDTSAQDNWEYTFKDVPKTDMNGKDYVYTVEEKDVPKGYTSKVNGTNIMNTLNDDENNIVSVSVQKTWDDKNDSSARPTSLKIELFRDTKTTAINKISLGANSNLSSFLSVQKTWDDKNENSARSTSLKTELFRDTQATAIDEVRLVADSNWSYTFVNLPKFAPNGDTYIYSIKEESVPDYTLTKSTIEKESDGNSWTATLINKRNTTPGNPPSDTPNDPPSDTPNDTPGNPPSDTPSETTPSVSPTTAVASHRMDYILMLGGAFLTMLWMRKLTVTAD